MQEYVNPHYNILVIVSSVLKVIMASIINRTEEDQIKIIDKDAKNNFTWSWLEKFVTVEIEDSGSFRKKLQETPPGNSARFASLDKPIWYFQSFILFLC